MRGSRRSYTNSVRAQTGNFTRTAAASKYYSYGSSAAKIEEARDDVSIRYFEKSMKKERKYLAARSFTRILLIGLVCFCAIVVVYAKSNVYNYHLKNEELKATLEDERLKTETILALNAEKIDLAYVDEAARTKLNMAKPQSYQIQYIEVPKTDYTVVHQPSITEKKENMTISSFKNILGSIQDTTELLGLTDIVKKESTDNEADNGSSSETLLQE